MFRPVVGTVTRVTNIRCKGSGRRSITVHIVTSRVHAVTFSVASNRLPSGTGTNCMVHHVLHHTIHCKCAFLKRGRTFVCGLLPMLVRGVNRTCPRLVTRGKLVRGIVGRRRRTFLHALRANVHLLSGAVTSTGTDKGARVDKGSTFALCSAFKFPLSLARLVLHRGGVAIGVRRFSTRVRRRGRHTHGTTTMRANS